MVDNDVHYSWAIMQCTLLCNETFHEHKSSMLHRPDLVSAPDPFYGSHVKKGEGEKGKCLVTQHSLTRTGCNAILECQHGC